MPVEAPNYNPAQELVIIVDAENNATGTATRAQMRAQGLIYRASYVLVFNKTGELFIQKRTASKDIYPSHYDVAAGGVVLAGESYEESAARELHEELGIDNVELSFLFDHYHADADNKVWGRVFSCVYEGPMILQQEEIDFGVYIAPKKVLTMSRSEPFTPDGIDILHRFLKK